MVSVIIPVFNNSLTLTETLSSVQKQTYQDWECILVDDCSSDNSDEIIQQWVRNDQRFIYLNHTTNKGVSAARNTAMRLAKGEFIQFLDSDDVIAPNKLEQHVGFLEANDAIDLVYSDFFTFQKNIDFTNRGLLKSSEKISANGKRILRKLIHGNYLRINMPLFRRSIICDLGFFDTSLSHLEDWDLWLRMAFADKKFYYLDSPAAISGIRIRAGSLSRDSEGMRNCFYVVMKRVWCSIGLDLRPYWVYRVSIATLHNLFFHRQIQSLFELNSLLLNLIVGFFSLLLVPIYLIFIFWVFMKSIFIDGQKS